MATAKYLIIHVILAAICCTVTASASTAAGGPSSVCWKDTIDRGVGKPVHACPAGQQEDAGLCYPACKATYYGVGPARKSLYAYLAEHFPTLLRGAACCHGLDAHHTAHCFVIP